MINKILNWIEKKKKTYVLSEYNRMLSVFEKEDITINAYPVMLVELWKRLDVDNLIPTDPRRMMDTMFNIHHENIIRLISGLGSFNRAISLSNDEEIRLFFQQEFTQYNRVNLDLYFSTADGNPVDIPYCLKHLKQLILDHGDIIDSNDQTYYRRMARRMYSDILVLTTVLVSQIEI